MQSRYLAAATQTQTKLTTVALTTAKAQAPATKKIVAVGGICNEEDREEAAEERYA